MKEKVLISGSIIFWLLFGFYFGIGGYSWSLYLQEKTRVGALVEERNNAVKDLRNKLNQLPDSIFNCSLPSNLFRSTDREYHNKTFSSPEELELYLSYESISKLYPWLENIPNAISLVITACAFGLIGGIIQILKQVAFEDKPLESTKYFSLPVLGLLTGVIVLGITHLLPTIFFSSGAEISANSMMFISLFSGLFSKKLYERLSSIFDKLLITKP